MIPSSWRLCSSSAATLRPCWTSATSNSLPYTFQLPWRCLSNSGLVPHTHSADHRGSHGASGTSSSACSTASSTRGCATSSHPSSESSTSGRPTTLSAALPVRSRPAASPRSRLFADDRLTPPASPPPALPRPMVSVGGIALPPTSAPPPPAVDEDVAASSAYLTDLRQPAEWYPIARALQRTIIAHLGPTNSGKTHAALTSLRLSGGVYCGPLRLLACEVADQFNAQGVPCHLLTGQERRTVSGAQHTSCTMEMANLDDTIEVAVLDEVQLLGDPDRGWAWTRALLGIPARVVHVCGDAIALPVLERLVAECGDVLQVHHYTRLSPLTPLKHALHNLGQVEAGDCLVAFSRRAVHRLKREVQRRTGQSCSLVYGALPPEARRQQAMQFNRSAAAAAAPSSAASSSSASASPSSLFAPPAPVGPGAVLVASDAIGMGLNLNIRRVIFASLMKFDGSSKRMLKASEIKQIAGRAGRFKSSTPTGYVTCLKPEEVPLLHAALNAPSESLKGACLLPRGEDMALFSAHHSGLSLAQSMQRFADLSILSPHYFFGSINNQYRIANLLRRLEPPAPPRPTALGGWDISRTATLPSSAPVTPAAAAARANALFETTAAGGTAGGMGVKPAAGKLSMEELALFCNAPANMGREHDTEALLRFATDCAARRPGGVSVASAMKHAPRAVPGTMEELGRMEEMHTLLELYAWLAQRLPEAFPEGAAVAELLGECCGLVEAGLERLAEDDGGTEDEQDGGGWEGRWHRAGRRGRGEDGQDFRGDRGRERRGEREGGQERRAGELAGRDLPGNRGPEEVRGAAAGGEKGAVGKGVQAGGVLKKKKDKTAARRTVRAAAGEQAEKVLKAVVEESRAGKKAAAVQAKQAATGVVKVPVSASPQVKQKSQALKAAAASGKAVDKERTMVKVAAQV